MFDLNGFKAINDRYGHSQGDQLLKAVAQRMRATTRDSDIVCRWGGDEFVIILKILKLSSRADAEARARQIQVRAFGEFILDRGTENIRVSTGACVGVAEYETGETAAEFFERADQLLLEEKRSRSAFAHPLRRRRGPNH